MQGEARVPQGLQYKLRVGPRSLLALGRDHGQVGAWDFPSLEFIEKPFSWRRSRAAMRKLTSWGERGRKGQKGTQAYLAPGLWQTVCSGLPTILQDKHC